LIINVFSTKLHAHEMFVSREFRTTFQGRARKYLRTHGLNDRHGPSPIFVTQ